MIMSAHQESRWDWTGEIDELHLFLDPAALRDAARNLTDRRVGLVDALAVRDPGLADLAWKLNTELAAPGFCSHLLVDSLTQQPVVQLLRRHSTLRRSTALEQLDIPPHRLRAALEFIEAHLAEDVSLVALATAVSMSPLRLARGFKKALGHG